jgi:hypothetical protein
MLINWKIIAILHIYMVNAFCINYYIVWFFFLLIIILYGFNDEANY